MTAFILPKGRTQFCDSNGAPLAGGSVSFFVPNTTTPKDTYQDSGSVALNTNPVVLDAAGTALIYGSGSYRQVVKDAAGNTIFDATTDEAASTSNIKLLPPTLFETGAVASGTGVIPTDDTIPQSTEGTQFMSLTVTPTNAGSRLIIDVVWNGVTTATAGNLSVALFQDAGANALAAIAQSNTNNLQSFAFRHQMTAGTTSPTTFKVRAGASSAGTTVFNGAAAGTRVFGGVYASSITVTEVLP